MKRDDGAALLSDLLTDPEEFARTGRGNALLEVYFAGFPKDSLVELLRSDNLSVQRTAAFIASELGAAAGELVVEMPRLLRASDPHVVWYACEVIAVCAYNEHVALFANVARMLELPSGPLVRLAMRLICRAERAQLEGANEEMRNNAPVAHLRGLAVLLTDDASVEIVDGMLQAQDLLLRRYGAIAACRHRGTRPQLITLVAASEDPDISSICG